MSNSSILEHTLVLIDGQIKKQEDNYRQQDEPHFSINQIVYYLTDDGQIILSTVVQILSSVHWNRVHYRIKPAKSLSWIKRVHSLFPGWYFPRHAVTAGNEIFKTLKEAYDRLLLNDAHRSITNLLESKILDAHLPYNAPLTISDTGATE